MTHKATPHGVPANAALVSIVIPTYNRSRMLARATASALAQDHPAIEVVVVDDASCDDTAGVLAANRDSRLVVFQQSANVGMVKNWGKGLELAHGEYVVFLADDDRLEPSFVTRRLELLATDPRLALAFSPYRRVSLDGAPLGTTGPEYRAVRRLTAVELLGQALSRTWFIGATLYRTAVVRSCWERIAQDDLVLDLGLNVELTLSGLVEGVFVPASDCVMTEHSGQNSLASQDLVFAQTAALLRRLLARDLATAARVRLRRELADWLVVWGRKEFVRSLPAARAHFREALRVDPLRGWAWRQLLVSRLWPGRLARQEAAGR